MKKCLRRKKPMGSNRTYKIGDIVKIKSIDWYYKNNRGGVIPDAVVKFGFGIMMKDYCGKFATIKHIGKRGDIRLNIDNGVWAWSDDMFDDMRNSYAIE